MKEIPMMSLVKLRERFEHLNSGPITPESLHHITQQLLILSDADCRRALRGLGKNALTTPHNDEIFDELKTQNAIARNWWHSMEKTMSDILHGGVATQFNKLSVYVTTNKNWRNYTSRDFMRLCAAAFDLDKPGERDGLALLEKILENAPPSFAKHDRVLHLRGTLLNRRGKYAKVIDMAEDLFPDHPSISDEATGIMARAFLGRYAIAEALHQAYHEGRTDAATLKPLLTQYKQAFSEEEGLKADITGKNDIGSVKTIIWENMHKSLDEAIAWNETGFKIFRGHYTGTNLMNFYLYRAPLENSQQKQEEWLNKAARTAEMVIFVTERDNVEESLNFWINASWVQAAMVYHTLTTSSQQDKKTVPDQIIDATLIRREDLDWMQSKISMLSVSESQKTAFLGTLHHVHNALRNLHINTHDFEYFLESVTAATTSEKAGELQRTNQISFRLPKDTNITPAETIRRAMRNYSTSARLHTAAHPLYLPGGNFRYGGTGADSISSALDWTEYARLLYVPIRELILEENKNKLPKEALNAWDRRMIDLPDVQSVIETMRVLVRQHYDIEANNMEDARSFGQQNFRLNKNMFIALTCALQGNAYEAAPLSQLLSMKYGINADCRGVGDIAVPVEQFQEAKGNALLTKMERTMSAEALQRIRQKFRETYVTEYRTCDCQIRVKDPILPGTGYIEDHRMGLIFEHENPDRIATLVDALYENYLRWQDKELNMNNVSIDQNGIPHISLTATLMSTRTVKFDVLPTFFSRQKILTPPDEVYLPIFYGLIYEGSCDLIHALSTEGKMQATQEIKTLRAAYERDDPTAFFRTEPNYVSPGTQEIDDYLLREQLLPRSAYFTESDLAIRALNILYFAKEEYPGYKLFFAAQDYVQKIIKNPSTLSFIITEEIKTDIAQKLVTRAAAKILSMQENPFPGLVWTDRIREILASAEDPIKLRPHLAKALLEMPNGTVVTESLDIDCSTVRLLSATVQNSMSMLR